MQIDVTTTIIISIAKYGWQGQGWVSVTKPLYYQLKGCMEGGVRREDNLKDRYCVCDQQWKIYKHQSQFNSNPIKNSSNRITIMQPFSQITCNTASIIIHIAA